MSRRKMHLVMMGVVFLVSVGMLGWSAWPPAAGQTRIFIRPDALTLPRSSNPPAAVLEPRILTLLWPRTIRLADWGRVRMDFVRDSASQPDALPENAPSDLNVMVDARLEMPNARVVPLGLVSQTMLPGQPVYFEWQVAPYQPGLVDGTLWVYFRYVAAGSGEQEQVLIAVTPVQVRSVTLGGLSAGVVRAAGWVGVILGVILSLPFLDEAVRRMWMRPSVSRQKYDKNHED